MFLTLKNEKTLKKMRSKTLKNNIFFILGRNLIIRSFEIPHSIWKLHKDFKSVFVFKFRQKTKKFTPKWQKPLFEKRVFQAPAFRGADQPVSRYKKKRQKQDRGSELSKAKTWADLRSRDRPLGCSHEKGGVGERKSGAATPAYRMAGEAGKTGGGHFGQSWTTGLCSEGEPSEPGGNRDCQLRTSELEQDLSSKSQRWNSKIDENYFPGCDLYPWGAFDNNHDLKLQYLSRCFLNIVPLSHVS